MSVTLIAKSAEEMRRIGCVIGRELFPSAFIALYGDLGAGKTTLVKGIAESLGITNIASPTFTIVRHHVGEMVLDHFDAYRIESMDELTAIGYDDYLNSGSVIIMEWCENVPDAIPNNRLEIRIEGSGAEARTLSVTAHGDEYLPVMEALKKW